MNKSSEKLLNKLGLKPFRPLPFIRSGKSQTIVGSYWPHAGELAGTKLIDFKLSDGDQLVLAENTPETWVDGNRVIVLVHGLTGCYQSSYMIRMTRAFYSHGMKIIRINLRGCGPGVGKAQKPYHCGISEDTRSVLEWLAQSYPKSPVTQIGFSLGGNISLKMAGEDADRPSGNLDSVVAVSPPIDVKESSRLLSSPENAFFDRHFTRKLLSEVKILHRHFPKLPAYNFPRKPSLATFDELYTAPRSGFRNGQDYYEKASSLPLLSKISVPTLILGAEDDPVVSGACFRKIPKSDWIETLFSAHGGHVGFLGYGAPKTLRWSDEVILRWVLNKLGLSSMRQ